MINDIYRSKLFRGLFIVYIVLVYDPQIEKLTEIYFEKPF